MRRLLLFFMMCLMALSINAQRCAVLDFQVGTGVTAEDIEGISFNFRSNFRPVGYTMLERFLINKVIQDSGFDPKEMIMRQVLQVGRSLDASVIVVGTMNKFMDEYSVDIRVINVSTGTTIASEGAAFARSDYRTSMQNVAQKLSKKLVPSSGGSSKSPSEPNNAVQPERNEPYIIYDYLKVFPKDLGTFSSEPKTIIAKLNQSQQYGYGTWRLPTNEELALMINNNVISRGNYMSKESPSGILRLVTDKEKGVITPAVPAGYVDLGLPSGKLWKDKNESGLFTYDQAVSRFGKNLPTQEELEELKSECKWSWTGSGMKVTGPNGNSIYLPAAGYRNSSGGMYNVGSSGYYWSSTPNGSDYAWCLYFSSGGVRMYDYSRSYGHSVRLVQDK